MKIKPEQLPNTLAKRQTPLPIALITGDEPLLQAEAADQTRAYLRDQGFTERELLHVDAQFNWDQVFESANSLSLFAERKILEVRLGGYKLTKAISDQLQRYLDNPAPDTALLIIADRMDGSSKRSAWVKRIEQEGLIVEIWPIELERLPDWLSKRALSKGVNFEPDALQLLSDRIEGNLLAADQELEKLALLFPNTRLSADQVDLAVGNSARFDIFALTDAALAQQPARVHQILGALKQEGVEPPVILWALTRDLRTLCEVIQSVSEGKSYDSLAQRLRIWGKRKGLMRSASRNRSINQIEQLLTLCAQADNAIKGLNAADPWLLIDQVLLGLSGVELTKSLSA